MQSKWFCLSTDMFYAFKQQNKSSYKIVWEWTHLHSSDVDRQVKCTDDPVITEKQYNQLVNQENSKRSSLIFKKTTIGLFHISICHNEDHRPQVYWQQAVKSSSFKAQRLQKLWETPTLNLVVTAVQVSQLYMYMVNLVSSTDYT